MARRFFVPQSYTGDLLQLTGSEAHHILHVLRMQPGEQAWVFDGKGNEALVEIRAVTGNGAELSILERREDRDQTVPLVLATAVPKGDRFRWLVEKATELGVQRLVPLVLQRSIVDPGSGKLQKMRQTIVEASKQCGRSQLMELDEPTTWKSFVAREFPGNAAFLADPSGSPRTNLTHDGRGMVVAIGPEGGFTDEERKIAWEAGAHPLSLGLHILRIETAALAAAALFSVPATKVIPDTTED